MTSGAGQRRKTVEDALRSALAEVVSMSTDQIGLHANLIEAGMNSLEMMRLAGYLRTRKLQVSFGQLMASPTLASWIGLLDAETPSPGAHSGELGWIGIAKEDGVRAGLAGPFALAPMQYAYWAGRKEGQALGGVNSHFYVEFDGTDVDPIRLEQATRSVLARHGMLRMRVLPDETQCIDSARDFTLRQYDWANLPRDAAAAKLEDLRSSCSGRQMDLTRGEVLDIQISRFPRNKSGSNTRVHISLDMVAADALSLRILLRDLAFYYENPQGSLLALRYSFPAYLEDRDRYDRQPDRLAARERAREYWLSLLDGLPGPPQLPIASGSTFAPANKIVRRSFWLNAERLRLLEEGLRSLRLTLSMALASIFAEVLSAWSSEPRFLLNVPLFNREPLHGDVGFLVGDFTSSVLLAWDGGAQGSLLERALRLQKRFHADADHADFSGVDVLRELSKANGKQVLAPVVFTSAVGLGALFSAEVSRSFGSPVWIVSQGPQVWLDVQVAELDGGLLVNWDAREEAFLPGVLDGMFAAHMHLLESLSSDPANWNLPPAPLLPIHQAEVRRGVNSPGAGAASALLHASFFRNAAEMPGRTALCWGMNDSLAYGELAVRSLRIAAGLRMRGVGKGDLVGIHLPKGPAQISAVLGVLAAGGAYLPIGVEQPVARRDRILRNAGTRVVIVESAFQADGAGTSFLCLADLLQSPQLAAPIEISPDALAYVIYTSGSTGEPKGVEITHAAAWNTIAEINRRYAVLASDRVLALSALDFDLSVYDVFGLLSAGGALVLPCEQERRDAEAWTDLISTHHVTIWNTVPVLLEMLLAGGTAQGLRIALISGDWIPLDLPRRVRESAPQCRFISLGGATEAAIWSNFLDVDAVDPAWKSIPYGSPLRGQHFRVVDALERDSPDWVPGELWIGGAGVAQGYRGAPDLTAQKFPMWSGERWYRTGDRGRYWPDGTLEFLGRIDQQVKLRGHRVELGEIESVLASSPGVQHAIVLLGPRNQLFAIVLEREHALAERSEAPLLQAMEHSREQMFLTHLRERLLPVMVPDRLLLSARLPVTSNGKVDRRLLQEALSQCLFEPAARGQAPASPLELLIAGVWKDVLDLPVVTGSDNFFLLGGDSLAGTRIVARLREAGIAGASLPRLFAKPLFSDFTSGLAVTKEASSDSAAGGAVTLMPLQAERYDPFPLTEVQRSYWLGRRDEFVLGGVGCHFYREYDMEDLDVPRLEEAIHRLVAKHEMLRAIVDESGLQRILREVPRFRIQPVIADGDPAEAFAAMRRRASHRVFDPERWPLFAVEAALCSNRARIAIGIDNLIADALSVLLFYRDLARLYRDPSLQATPPGLSFRDYVIQVKPGNAELEAAEKFWAERTALLPDRPQLPLAIDPSNVRKPRFERRTHRLPQALWEALKDKARTHDVTPSAMLLAAYAQVVSYWSASPDLTLTVTLFDRRAVHPEIFEVIGDFTSLMLVPHQPPPGAAWIDVVRELQQRMTESFEYRSVPVTRILRDLARHLGRTEASMPVVFTSALGVPREETVSDAEIFAHEVWGISQTPQVWIDHQVMEDRDGLRLSWDSVDELFPAGLVDSMFASYIDLIFELSVSSWQDSIQPHLPASQVAMRQRLVRQWEAPARDVLHRRFFELARSDGERFALLTGDGATRSYRQLAEESLRIAHLLRANGIAQDDVVAIHLDKGMTQIAAVFGVLAAGAAYVPIGVDQPVVRLDHILMQAGARAVLSETLTLSSEVCPVLHPQGAASFPPLEDAIYADTSSPAYIIFTSGSTGEPKGVEISHDAAWNTIADVNARFGVRHLDRVLAVSALDFDLSVYDIFGLLSCGGSLVLPSEEERRDANRWAELVQTYECTLWNSVPALVEMLLLTQPRLTSLKLVLASGDWVPVDLADRVHARCPAVRFVSLGGATEASIWSIFQEVPAPVPAWNSVPYGRPLRAQKFRVVDMRGRDCPDWVRGELWIGGSGVARGYRGSPGVTAERFVEWQGERWYRTGDYGRYWPDGTLEFLGRIDQQIKLRGHRIELGEVESCLSAAQEIIQAAAFVRGEGAQRQLAAAIVLGSATGDTAPRPVPGSAESCIAADPGLHEGETFEALCVEHTLVTILDLASDLADSGKTIADWNDSLSVADPFREVVGLWMRWLESRRVLGVAGETIQPGDRFREALGQTPDPASSRQRLVARSCEALRDRKEDLRGILAGTLDRSVLLTEESLSPAALAIQDEETRHALDDIAKAIRDMAQGKGEAVHLIELGGRDGGTAEYLLSRIAPEDVRYTLMDTSSVMLASARKRLQSFPHRIDTIQSPTEALPIEVLGGFDGVLANQSLHRYREADDGVWAAATLLRPSGTLFVLERRELSPLGLVLVALLEKGFEGYSHSRSERGTPMLPPGTWIDLLRANGFSCEAVDSSSSGSLFILAASKPAMESGLDAFTLRDRLTRNLPAYMVPESLFMLRRLPLTANGKVDRRALAAHLKDAPRAAGAAEALEGEVENGIARIWTDLLGVEVLDRRQSFFLAGGDSLFATRMIEIVHKRFGVRLSMRQLFSDPTVMAVAAAIDGVGVAPSSEFDTGIL